MSLFEAGFNLPPGVSPGDPRAPWNAGPGQEDLIGARLFLEEEDEWVTVTDAEDWMDEEADEDGYPVRYGGTTYTMRVDGTRCRDVHIEEGELEELLEHQDPELLSHDPKRGEFPCPHCGQGCYSVRDNSDAPIPIRVPPSVHDDEGRPIGQCPNCDEDLIPRGLAL